MSSRSTSYPSMSNTRHTVTERWHSSLAWRNDSFHVRILFKMRSDFVVQRELNNLVKATHVCHVFLNMYYLYILKCADKTLYTGITVDLKRRVAEHNLSERGAKYTRARRPVKLVFSKKFKNRSLASKAESKIKKLTRVEKLKLIAIS